jgi:Tfp pilus assembly protein PilX
MIIIAVIYAVVVTAQRSTANMERKVVAGQDARGALELIAIEIQMASYNPTYATGIWEDPATCVAGSGNQLYRGIQAATATSLSVEADINDNGVLGGTGNTNEIITYAYDTGNQYITRETNCGGAQPFLGDIADSGRPRSVRVINTTAVPVLMPRGPRLSLRDCRPASRTSPALTLPCGWKRRMSIRIRDSGGGWCIPRASSREIMSSADRRRGTLSMNVNQRGFALVTAILAIMILMALGYLVVSVSTGDLKISSRVVGEKKALSAAETGIHRMMQNFDPANITAIQASGIQVDAAADPGSKYTIANVGRPAGGPEMLPMSGYSIGGGQQWGQRRYVGSVTGISETYNSSVQIDTGMGYGPIEISTMSR